MAGSRRRRRAPSQVGKAFGIGRFADLGAEVFDVGVLDSAVFEAGIFEAGAFDAEVFDTEVFEDMDDDFGPACRGFLNFLFLRDRLMDRGLVQRRF